MTTQDGPADTTPVLVGAGQVVQREATTDSPMQLAAEAARRALDHAGGNALAAAIDTVSVTRLFSDSMGMPPCPFGRSDNPPMSVARALGAAPKHCIYGQVGGTEPQARLIEFAGDIARGDREMVLLAGAEALRNQRSAERSGESLDWSEAFAPAEFPLQDRGWGELFVSEQEIRNGMLAPVLYYGLIDQALAFSRGQSEAQHRAAMSQLLAPFSEVAAANPYAQFPAARSAQALLDAAPLDHLYSRDMIARDGVNQGAALLLCSVGAAKRLGIPRENWVFLHGMAQGDDHALSQRADPARSRAAEAVLARTFELAGKTIDDIDLLDLYSCFPCAVSAVADYLGLPADGSRALTLTGGLPFFGGPGNNYAMHALAEVVMRLRHAPQACALVGSVGGVLSKYAAGIYSREPSVLDWADAQTALSRDALPSRPIAEAPRQGHILSYLLNYRAGEPGQALALAETTAGERFVATAVDAATLAGLAGGLRAGQPIAVAAAAAGALNFTLV